MNTKITSWNVNSLKVRLPQVLDYLKTESPDLLALQELKQEDQAVDKEAIENLGYNIITHGQKTYNGVAIISKTPAENIEKGLISFPEDPQARAIGARYQNLYLLNLYVPNGKAIDDEKYHYKLHWLKALKTHLEQLIQQEKNIIIVGDFNIAPEDIDTHDPEKWRDKILCSEKERQALNEILALGFKDSFRHIHPKRQQFSWWDYRMSGLRRNLGLRIDLALSQNHLEIQNADIDIKPRQQERPSDHAPVWLEIKTP